MGAPTFAVVSVGAPEGANTAMKTLQRVMVSRDADVRGCRRSYRGVQFAWGAVGAPEGANTAMETLQRVMVSRDADVRGFRRSYTGEPSPQAPCHICTK
jgi:hypothetical protein